MPYMAYMAYLAYMPYDQNTMAMAIMGIYQNHSEKLVEIWWPFYNFSIFVVLIWPFLMQIFNLKLPLKFINFYSHFFGKFRFYANTYDKGPN